MRSVEQKTCASCKAPFSCGAAKGEAGTCWCESVSGTLVSPNAELDCFCPECLPLMINNQDSAGQPPPVDTDSSTQSDLQLVEEEDATSRAAGPSSRRSIIFNAVIVARAGAVIVPTKK